MTRSGVVRYSGAMIEKIFLLIGLGFSLLVYFRSMKNARLSFFRKTFYFLITLVGITGTLSLIGVMVSHFLSRLHILR